MSVLGREGWKKNPGRCPEEAKGKRVRVILAHGDEPKYDSEWQPMSKPGWPADGKGGCVWSKRGIDQDIEWYRVL